MDTIPNNNNNFINKIHIHNIVLHYFTVSRIIAL